MTENHSDLKAVRSHGSNTSLLYSARLDMCRIFYNAKTRGDVGGTRRDRKIPINKVLSKIQPSTRGQADNSSHCWLQTLSHLCQSHFLPEFSTQKYLFLYSGTRCLNTSLSSSKGFTKRRWPNCEVPRTSSFKRRWPQRWADTEGR